ncbi:MAG TPA: hypothetical protein VIE63_12970 [Ramlibacter sp.]|jgi:hypothetical protein
MDKNDARAMKDRHARDEAAERRLQQQAAGDSHSPVEAYPQHGAQSGFAQQPEALVNQYEHALQEEAAAWARVKQAGDAADFSARWDEWRSLVEKRDAATRFLINQSMAGTRR